MPLRKHYAFQKNGRVYINQSAYAALTQEATRLQNKRNTERERAIIAASTERRQQERNREQEHAQLRALTAFLEERGVHNPTAMIAPPQPPTIAIPPVLNLTRALPNSFRRGIPLLLSRFQDLGQTVSVAVFHSRKHARESKSKLRAVVAFGGNAAVPPPRLRPIPTPVVRTMGAPQITVPVNPRGPVGNVGQLVAYNTTDIHWAAPLELEEAP